MGLFRITHIDVHHKRRCLRVLATNCRQALRAVEQEFGDAWYASAIAIKVKGGAA